MFLTIRFCRSQISNSSTGPTIRSGYARFSCCQGAGPTNITITAQGFELPAAIDTFLRRALETALQLVNRDIMSIHVFLKDANGPKGGIDKQALIRTRLRNRQLIAINTRHEDLYAAAKNGVQRMKRAVRRNLR